MGRSELPNATVRQGVIIPDTPAAKSRTDYGDSDVAILITRSNVGGFRLPSRIQGFTAVGEFEAWRSAGTQWPAGLPTRMRDGANLLPFPGHPTTRRPRGGPRYVIHKHGGS